MLPIKLLFYPPSVVSQQPVRKWRNVTLWLKWGLLFSLIGVLLRVVLVENPETVSYFFQLLNYLAAENDSITLTFTIKFGLFFLVQIFLVLAVWLIRSGVIYLIYQMIDTNFTEGQIALSIGGASLVNGIWMLLPSGWILSILHGIILIGYLMSRINRLSIMKAALVSIPPGLVTFLI